MSKNEAKVHIKKRNCANGPSKREDYEMPESLEKT